jgi:hypothetical protein
MTCVHLRPLLHFILFGRTELVYIATPFKRHSCCYTIHDYLRPLTSSVVLFFLRTERGFICREPVILQSSYFTIYYSIHDHMHPLTYYYGVCFLCMVKNVWTKLSHWYAKRTMKCVKWQMVRKIYIAHCTLVGVIFSLHAHTHTRTYTQPHRHTIVMC